MIHTRLSGGLGNQLFQYCASLAIKNKTFKHINLYTNSLSDYGAKRKLQINYLIDLPKYVSVPNEYSTRTFLQSNLLRIRFAKFLPFCSITDKNFSKILEKINANKIISQTNFLDGYFQYSWSENEFFNSLSIVREQLKENLKNIPSLPFVIHIRGKDLKAYKYSKFLDHNYYLKALAFAIKKNSNLNSAKVITDDKLYAKKIIGILSKEFPHIQIEIYDKNKLKINYQEWLADFYLIMNSNFRIIGNSTFAWWATCLDKKESFTISPNIWLENENRNLFLPYEKAISV